MKFICAILCLLSSLTTLAQKVHSVLEIDHLNNRYTIKGSELKKYSPQNEVLFNFSDPFLGDITSIDVSNPLRLLLFYKALNQIIYLDQNLSPISEPIDLYRYSDNETQLCCNASVGGFWIYNQYDSQSFHISTQGQTINKSNLLNSYFKTKQPSKLIEYREKLYFLIPSQGILILNKFGLFLRQIPLPKIADFSFNNQDLIYLKDNTWFRYKPISKTDPIVFKLDNSKKCLSKIKNDQILIYDNDSLKSQNIKP